VAWTEFVWFMIKIITGFCEIGNEYLGWNMCRVVLTSF